MSAASKKAAPSGRWFPRNYKQAEKWLRMAADADPPLAEAAFALSVLNGIRGYSQRDLSAARIRLQQAANQGHPEACWQMGRDAFRRSDDIGAAQWWLRAATAGHPEAINKIDALLPSVAMPSEAMLEMAKAIRHLDPTLSLRLELGAHFRLVRHEFLLLDPHTADQGDFLVVDVRHSFGKAKRRLLRISTPSQREVLKRARLTLPGGKPLEPREYQALRRHFTHLCAPFEKMQASAPPAIAALSVD